MNLNLIVLRCADIEASKRFYEVLGLRFAKHAHGTGPEHYAHEDSRGVFELYLAKQKSSDQTGLGFSAPNLNSVRADFETRAFAPEAVHENPWGISFVVRDPDGRRVEITETKN